MEIRKRKSIYDMTSDVLVSVARTIREIQQAREITRAASVLGRLRAGYRRNRGRSKPKKWTGFLSDGARAWWGRRVFLPDGKVGYVCAIIRGQAAVRWDDPLAIEGVRFGLFKATDLRPYRLPAAIILGRSKKGVRERPSQRKAQAARLNGRMPTRPGSRPRGRPRTDRPLAIEQSQ